MNLNSYLKKCLKNKEFRECFIQDIKELEQELNVKILEEDKENLNNKKQLKENITVKTFEEKAQALVDYLNEYEGEELTLDDCREGYDENIIELEDGREYIVCDIEQAEELAREDIQGIWEDLGLDSFTSEFKKRILDEFVDEDKARDLMRDDLEDYYNEFSDEELADEAIDYGYVESYEVYDENSDEYAPELRDDFDRDVIIKKLVDYRGSYENPSDYFENLFSGEDLAKFIEENNLIDLEAVKDECIDLDGIAHFIASYDGEELELDGDLYAYRRN